MQKENNERNGFEIAILGMSGKFPGAKNTDELWENLKNGVFSIDFFTKEEVLEKSSVAPDTVNNPNFIAAKGIIDKPGYFDSHFFGYSPTEAEILDPQMRIFHEICWETLEDAGCDPSTYPGLISLYAGGSSNRWWEVLTVITGKTATVGHFASDYLIDKDVLSTRTSYKLDLRGAAVTIHTACSTGLVAVDLACRALLTGLCDAALAGGTSLMFQSAKAGGYLYQEGMINSSDGYVRAFDAKAGGVVFSDGAGAVLLKRLDDAIADGDNIYAVIKGFATNNDGIDKSSFTAPAIDGQAEVIRMAHYNAEVDPRTITYVEAHGTGTIIGDPIEIEALTTAFNTDEKQYCAVGSIKTNIGHLDTAAGIAALIKATLMIKNRLIPPSLNFETPNPKINFENSPFFVNTQLREWKTDGFPLRAGVSSFGVGGTNAHVILEEAPPREPTTPGRPYNLTVISARSAKALEQATTNLVNYLETNPNVDFSDVAFTMAVGRKTFEHRRMLVCTDARDCIEKLKNEHKDEISDGQGIQNYYIKEQRRAIFMFPGQGSQYVNMARGIYDSEPLFREEMERCFNILKEKVELDICDIVYPGQSHPAGSAEDDLTPGSVDINRTEITQPLLFTIEYALAKLLMSWGIEPYAMTGHSIGEYTAACLSGVFSLEDALTLVAWRGKLMQSLPPGDMLSVSLPVEELKPLLVPGLSIAAVNAPDYCVVSGQEKTVAAFARDLDEKKIQYRELHTSHAFHSDMMEPILETFAETVAQVERNKPRIPFISNLSGTWISHSEAIDPNYWAQHIRSSVRFADGAAELLKNTGSVFIEVGPGRTLGTFVRRHPAKQPGHQFVNLVRHPKEDVDDLHYLLEKLGRIWMYGVPVNWQEYYVKETRKKLRLPTYPFQRQLFELKGNPSEIINKGLGGSVTLSRQKNMLIGFILLLGSVPFIPRLHMILPFLGMNTPIPGCFLSRAIQQGVVSFPKSKQL